MTPYDIVELFLQTKNKMPIKDYGEAFAPANIALCKYWGKRESALNLPMTSSLSIGLNDRGAKTRIQFSQSQQDEIFLNDKKVDNEHPFYIRTTQFLDLFRFNPHHFFHFQSHLNIPMGAGVASSAAGFAALVLAFDDWYGWKLEKEKLSILARMGSGSAARSIWEGFVELKEGSRSDGLDSYGVPLELEWPELRIGLCLLEKKPKSISSRVAMKLSQETSVVYKLWPDKVKQDLKSLKESLYQLDFYKFGQISESNAILMHAVINTAWPPICYHLPETIQLMHKIWQLRKEGLALFFTQDAGPNLKLLFLEKDLSFIVKTFPKLEIICPFNKFSKE
ncbi:MAG: Diphosphomevalonate decarboxylase [Francisellaceae bacterium]|nr:Diphosphomevalonate decarboxylase [Francisellaceae bacterium]